ncbi:hypothetical protein ACLOJK_008496 [Asimina triloba]
MSSGGEKSWSNGGWNWRSLIVPSTLQKTIALRLLNCLFQQGQELDFLDEDERRAHPTLLIMGYPINENSMHNNIVKKDWDNRGIVMGVPNVIGVVISEGERKALLVPLCKGVVEADNFMGMGLLLAHGQHADHGTTMDDVNDLKWQGVSLRSWLDLQTRGKVGPTIITSTDQAVLVVIMIDYDHHNQINGSSELIIMKIGMGTSLRAPLEHRNQAFIFPKRQTSAAMVANQQRPSTDSSSPYPAKAHRIRTSATDRPPQVWHLL